MSSTQQDQWLKATIAKAAPNREEARLEIITEAVYDAVSGSEHADQDTFDKDDYQFVVKQKSYPGWTREHIRRLFFGVDEYCEVNGKYRLRFKGVVPTLFEIGYVLEELAALGYLKIIPYRGPLMTTEYKFVPCFKRRSIPKDDVKTDVFTEPSKSGFFLVLYQTRRAKFNALTHNATGARILELYH